MTLTLVLLLVALALVTGVWLGRRWTPYELLDPTNPAPLGYRYRGLRPQPVPITIMRGAPFPSSEDMGPAS